MTAKNDHKLNPEHVRVALFAEGNWRQMAPRLPDIYHLAFQQALQHAGNKEWLPDYRDNFGIASLAIKDAIMEDRVKAGLFDMPDAQGGYVAAGLLLLSPLWARVAGQGTVQGLQVDGVAVDKSQHRQTIGQYAISFAAYQSDRCGGTAIGWACEEGKSVQQVYEMMGAEKRVEKPFRLERQDINRIAVEMMPDEGCVFRLDRAMPLSKTFQEKAATWKFDALLPPSERDSFGPRYLGKLVKDRSVVASCLISQRVSALRLLGYMPDGINHENPTGYQIEDIRANGTTNAEKMQNMIRIIDEAAAELSSGEKGCEFIDLVGDPDDSLMREIAAHYDVAANSHAGSPSALWILQGEAFHKAAWTGSKLRMK